jgi:hypothetical protein
VKCVVPLLDGQLANLVLFDLFRSGACGIGEITRDSQSMPSCETSWQPLARISSASSAIQGLLAAGSQGSPVLQARWTTALLRILRLAPIAHDRACKSKCLGTVIGLLVITCARVVVVSSS